MPKAVEILAPVSTWDMCKAAVHNGAGAIYLGMPGFNARARSQDWSKEELRELIHYCHQYEVKVFIAFNILIFESELSQVAGKIADFTDLNIDAYIVQDIGLLRLIQDIDPEQVVHASTQLTTTHPASTRFFEDLNIKRYVLSREMSITEITAFKKDTDVEIEVFVHGALCVAYSGQCLTSERSGGRSANRGQCAQSCRLSYELFCNDKKVDLKKQPYLFSPADLCGVEHVEQLKQIGVDSFKIEGRYKSPEYVATTTKVYADKCHQKNNQEMMLGMEVGYSRGFYSGWLDGVHHQNLVEGTNNHHVGKEIGIVQQVQTKPYPSVQVQSDYTFNKGESLLFFNQNNQELVGSQIFQVQNIQKNIFQLGLSKELDTNLLQQAKKVHLNRSPQLDKHIQQSYTNKEHFKKIPLTLSAKAKLGQPLEVCYTYQKELTSKVFTETPLSEAQKQPLEKERLLKTLSALGGTRFTLVETQLEMDSNLFISGKEIKKARQKAIEELEILIQEKYQHRSPQTPTLLKRTKTHPVQKQSSPELHVLIRKPEQLDALEGLNISTIYLDYNHGVGYRSSVAKVKKFGYQVGIAGLRILKPGKESILEKQLSNNLDVFLVRNVASLAYIKEKEPQLQCVGDFSLNITNHLSFDYLKSKNFDRLTASYDLNIQQLDSLLQYEDIAASSEITVHQYMPMFHMEHCVFATFLSDGTNSSNCGLVCAKNTVKVQDDSKVKHVLLADKDCKNTLYHGEAQSAAKYIPELIQKGVKNFRLEALDETPEALREKVKVYLKILEGVSVEQSGLSKLNIFEKYGITAGQLENNTIHIDRKK